MTALPAGVILAGGQSRRFGSDKPLALLHGRPLIAHVIAALAPQTRALAIASGSTPCRFAAFGLPELADPLADAGPLAGVLAGLTWAATLAPKPTHLLTAPADGPFLPDDLSETLVQADPHGTCPVIAAYGGNASPVVALWPLALAPALFNLVTRGVRRVIEAAIRLNAVTVDLPGPRDPLADIDTPTDLVRAQQG